MRPLTPLPTPPPPQALSSCTGRLAPRLALLSPQLVEQHVVQRVLRWAGMGGGGAGGGGTDLSVLLAEDALEVGGTNGVPGMGSLVQQQAAASTQTTALETLNGL